MSELVAPGRTLKKRAEDVSAFFERPGGSNGPAEATTDGSSTRGSALGFRNLTNYIPGSLLETGGGYTPMDREESVDTVIHTA